MVSVSTQNRIGYLLLTIGVTVGLVAAYKNDSAIKDVNRKQTNFIIQQCQRDDKRNDIVIDSLKGAQIRAKIALKNNPVAQAIEVQRIQDNIRQFENAPPCRLP